MARAPGDAADLWARPHQAGASTPAPTNALDAQLDLERDLQREAGRTPDYAEGVRAFMEKRAPEFTGRQ